jgi:hypothetical protein
VGEIFDILLTGLANETSAVLIVISLHNRITHIAGEKVDKGISFGISLAVGTAETADVRKSRSAGLVDQMISNATILSLGIFYTLTEHVLIKAAIHAVVHVPSLILTFYVCPALSVQHTATELGGENVKIQTGFLHLIQLIFVAVDVERIKRYPRADEKLVGGVLFHVYASV